MNWVFNHFIFLLSALNLSSFFTKSSNLNADEIQEIYSKLKKCLRYNRQYNLNYPNDAEQHYVQLMNITSRYRGIPVHSGGNYSGPWMENHFIDRFSEMPLSYFSGLFPLFVQWTDYQLRMRNSISDKEMFQEIRQVLRPNVLYLAVSQANHGLQFFVHMDPNVIVMSSGGDGNIPIPLIKGELPYQAIDSHFPKQDIGFYGSMDHGPRKYILTEMKQLLSKTPLRVKLGPSPTWINDMSMTSINLAPRGFGRASFRLSEIIQIGRIPVYLFDDHPWIPYKDTNISVVHIGILGKLGHLHEVIDKVSALSASDITIMLQRVKLARRYYTYEGVLEQIDLFFKDPLGPAGGQLRCSTIPSAAHTILDINI